MNWPIPTLADVLKARRVDCSAPAGRRRRSNRRRSPLALGCRAVLKCENLNPTGAFKVRGGINLLASLEPDVRARGVVAASTGNHGQSVAYAARLFGCKATIFMPEAANRLKVQATAALGAEVIETGRDFDAARLAAEEHAARLGQRYIHSANEPLLVAGVGTAALELLEAAPDLDVIFVPVGGRQRCAGCRNRRPSRQPGDSGRRRASRGCAVGLSLLARGAPGRHRKRRHVCRRAGDPRAV